MLINNKLFVGSIYKNKKILSINPENGKILWSKDLDLSPKSDLIFYEDKIISLATDGILNTSERLIPSELIILNAKDGTVHFKTKLRGANYFPQLVLNNSLILSLTTGDLISYNFKTNSIVSIDQIAEPFLSSPFKRNENFCAASIMGRIFCYSKDYKKVESMNTNEVIIGDIRPSNNEYYLPTRIGYLKLN